MSEANIVVAYSTLFNVFILKKGQLESDAIFKMVAEKLVKIGIHSYGYTISLQFK